jgi:hypothetical protein
MMLTPSDLETENEALKFFLTDPPVVSTDSNPTQNPDNE